MRAYQRGMLMVGALGLVVGVIFTSSATAMRFTSTDYVIDTGVLNNVGGNSSSTNYQLTSSGGEAAIGNGASGSYRLAAGYVAQVITPAITVKTQPSGLVAYYPLDENSGTVAHDASANTLNGIIQNTSWTTGKIGKALTFVGSNDTAVDLGNPSAFQSSNITVEAWMNTTYGADGVSIVSKGADAWKLGTAFDPNKDYASISNNSGECMGNTSVRDGAWHHLAATLQSGVANGTKLYVDGILQATCTLTITSQSADVFIGVLDGWLNYSFTGDIDQVKIFNRALSSDEIAAEYAAQNVGVETGLTLQTVIPGSSNTSSFDVITRTSGSSYTLAINQDHDLQNGVHTIPGITGSIASPSSWSEGATKGLGFTLLNTTATAISPIWNSGASYAAIPGSSTSFYTRTGIQSSKDVLGMQLRLDTASTQASGAYSNTMVITGTANP